MNMTVGAELVINIYRGGAKGFLPQKVYNCFYSNIILSSFLLTQALSQTNSLFTSVLCLYGY